MLGGARFSRRVWDELLVLFPLPAPVGMPTPSRAHRRAGSGLLRFTLEFLTVNSLCSVSLFLPPCARTDPSFNGSQRISAASRKGRLGCKHATPPHRNFCEQRAHHATQREPAGGVVHTRRRRLGFQTSLLVATAKGGVQAICNRITITPPLCSSPRVPSNPSRQYLQSESPCYLTLAVNYSV